MTVYCGWCKKKMSYDYDNPDWFKRFLKHVHKYHEKEMRDKEKREK